MDEVTHVETPRSWIWWSLVTAISAVSSQYYCRSLKGTVNWKPNLFVMLLGESGLGKGFGVNLSKLLVQHTETTRVLAGRASIQAIVSELAKAKTNASGKAPIMDSRGFIINGELSSAIIADVDALSILTDLYDGHYNQEWDNLLKISGKEKLKNPYLTALFGSSPDHFYDSIPSANIGGGYVARNLIVYEERRFQNVDLFEPEDTDEISDRVNGYIVPRYGEYLTKIGSSGGRIILNQSAKDLYNNWRRKWRETQVKERTGFFNRVPDHVIKTAMCLCLSRYNSGLIMNEFDVEDAIKKVTDLIYSNKIAAQGNSNQVDPVVAHTKTVINLLLAAPDNTLARRLLLSRAYPYGLCDTSTLDKILDNLYELGWIAEKTRGGQPIDWIIKLAGEPLEEYNKFKKSKEVK